MRFGIFSQKFVTTLAHRDCESAAQLFGQIDSTSASNDFVVETAIDREIFKGSCSKAIPLLSSSQCIGYYEGGGITIFEVYGYDEGIHNSFEDLPSFDKYGAMSSANGTGSFALQTSQGSMQAAARHSYRDMEETSAALSKKQGEGTVVRNDKVFDKKRAMDAAAAKHTEKRGVICVDCQEVYSKEATHSDHVHRGVCASRQCQAELKQTNKNCRQAEVERSLATRHESKFSAENQES
jgi:hypothetical protein